MTEQKDKVIAKVTWDNLPNSEDVDERDAIEEWAKDGRLIVKEGDVTYRPVEVPEAGWQLEKLPPR